MYEKGTEIQSRNIKLNVLGNFCEILRHHPHTNMFTIIFISFNFYCKELALFREARESRVGAHCFTTN